MKPEEALVLLDRVLQNIQGTRADHQKIQEALKVLQDATKGK